MLLPALVAFVTGAAIAPSLPVPETKAVVAAPSTKYEGMDAIAIPLLSFNSDLGVGYGVVGGMYIYGEGHTPYQHGLAAQVFFTNRGIQNHYIRYDGPQLLGPVRVEARFEYKREFRSPFYGAGNHSSPEFTGDVNDARYNYGKGSPSMFLRLRARPLGEDHPLQVYGGYSWRYTQVSPFEQSMLAELHPVGIEGGPTGQLLGGVLWDTRNSETDPTSGGAEEIAIRVSGHPTGSRYQYAGLALSERRYFQLGSRFVFAQRVSVDMLFGEVPFFEWSTTGGVLFTEGLGGMSSLRGIERNRFAGNFKVFSNSELRFHALEARIFGQPMKLGLVAFMDLGRVWHPGVTDGPWHQWHPGLGGGLRMSRRAAVVRVDYATSTENGGQRLYMNFGHMF
ncbi:Omp85 family outer membrane protein [Hyalangium versicolor]|uniref:Omp85 family outer membrane protein n=1 Tax=Hyalangium versicolor TaxID=2861190 RepID=UPI001CCD3A92|nr:BamA/TamA family outer membrane protein [Hyalangium versicolor]